MRRHSRSFFIYILFGGIIAVFVINFGPGSRGCTPEGPSGYAAKVAGTTLTEHDFRFAYIALGGPQFGQFARERRLKEFVMDKLIERELLAQEAERLGFAISAKEVEDMIADGRMVVLGVPRRVDSYVYKDGKFDYDRFKMVCQNQLGVSVMRFIDIERRELLADKLRELMKAATKVSPDEVKADFENRGLQVNLEFARFSPRRYQDAAEPTAAEIDAYVNKHADELKKVYEERAFLYKKLDKQARLRHVAIDLPPKAEAAQVEQAKQKLEQALAKVRAGTPLADVARSLSTDEVTKKRGGDMGWRKKGFTGLGSALEQKVFAAKKGQVLGPERTEHAFELVQVVDFREGDVPLAQAERELAEEKLREDRGKAKAKADAAAVLARVKKGEKLESILPKTTPEQADAERRPALAKLDADKGELPKLQETGLFSRRGDMVQDIGVSKELSKRAFELKPGEVAGPFEISGGYAIVRLKERKEPDLADFAKRKPELVREYERTKWAEVLDGWAKQRCAEALSDGRIQVNDEILVYEGAKAGPTKYTPCAGTRLF